MASYCCCPARFFLCFPGQVVDLVPRLGQLGLAGGSGQPWRSMARYAPVEELWAGERQAAARPSLSFGTRSTLKNKLLFWGKGSLLNAWGAWISLWERGTRNSGLKPGVTWASLMHLYNASSGLHTQLHQSSAPLPALTMPLIWLVAPATHPASGLPESLVT